MKAKKKVSRSIVAYCAFLWLTNWSTNTYTSSEKIQRLSSSSVDFRGLGVLIGVVASVVLLWRLCKIVRQLLAEGPVVPKSVKIWGRWSYLWLLAPLFFGLTYSFVDEQGAGWFTKTTFQYGGGISIWSFVCSGFAIMLYQLVTNVEGFLAPRKEGRTRRSTTNPTALASRPLTG